MLPNTTRLHTYAVLVGILFLLPFTALAQIGGGTIRGFLTDASAAVIPNAQLKAVNLDTNLSSETTSNDTGYYEFPLLPAGRYYVAATHEGFRPVRSAEFTLSTGTVPRVDLTMQVGASSSSVEVTAEAPVLNVSTTDLGQVITTQKVESLPLNGRNWQSLVGLQPGTVANPSNSTGQRGGIMFNGAPAWSNQLLLDGIDMTFGEIPSAPTDQAGGAGTSLIGGTSIGAIAEVKTNSNAFSAEFGSAVSGVVNITTKSGTNSFHGEVFEFFRNDALNASDFFSNKNGLAKPPLRWNQFGGNLGGPILKDRLFFFFNYEGARVRRSSQISGNTPTDLLLSQLTPALRENASGLPRTYTPTSNPLLGFSVRNATTADEEDTTLSRVDYNRGKQRLAVRYSYNWSDYRVPQFRPANFQTAPYTFYNVSAEHTITLAPNLLNEFRFGVNHNDLDRHNSTLGQLPGWFEVGSVNLIGDFQSRIHYINDTYTVADNFSWIKGAQTLRFGMQAFDLDSHRVQDTGMTTYYASLADLVGDNAQYVRATFGSPKDLHSWHYGFYVQDDWRVNRSLLVNVGLRYEYFTPMKGMFNVINGDPFGPFGQKSDPMFVSNRNDWGPRLGLAWNPGGSQRLVVRAGAGISYSPIPPMFLYDFAAIDPRVPFTANIFPADTPPGYTLKFPFPQAQLVQQVTSNPGLVDALHLTLGRSAADYHAKDTSAVQWNLSVQGRLAQNDSLQVTYAGNQATHIYVPNYPNQFLPGATTRPNPALGAVNWICNCGTSNYNSLQVSYNHRFSYGLVLDAYYTWAKALSLGGVNDVNNNGLGNQQDPYNLRGSIGPQSGDIANLFVMNYSYALPVGGLIQHSATGRTVLGGWSLDGILTKRSGLPVNVLAGLDLVRNQRTQGDRPNLVSGVDPYLRQDLQWFNKAAFDAQTPYNQRVYGNLGFNALRGPGACTWDASLHKQFRFLERQSLTFRVEAFNVLNHVVLNNPVNTVTSPQFGLITGGSSGRAFQLAAKYLF